MAVVIIISILLPAYVLTLPPAKTAQAGLPVSVVASVPVPVFELGWVKEGPLDIIAYTLAKILLHQITLMIVNWIQTGNFDGGPLFITFWKQFLEAAAMRGAIIFINELEAIASQITEPFRDYILTLFRNVAFNPYPHARSTIDQITNPDEFYGHYRKGGSEAFLESILNPSNNALGIYFMEAARLEAQKALELASDQGEAIASQGFIGFSVCEEWSSPGQRIDGHISPAGQTCLKRSIKTPGKIAEEGLSKAINKDLSVLEVSDEIDEIINAIMQRVLFSILDFATDASENTDTFGGTSRYPEKPIPETPPPGVDGTTPPPAPSPDSIAVVNSCAGTSAVNIITWTPTTSGAINVVYYCVGQGCLPTSNDSFACPLSTLEQGLCIHENVVPGVTYSYRVYQGTAPLTNVVSATAQSCTP